MKTKGLYKGEQRALLKIWPHYSSLTGHSFLHTSQNDHQFMERRHQFCSKDCDSYANNEIVT